MSDNRPKLKVAFLWHNHQPFYKDNLTGIYELPWVRLHAVKDYYDTLAILEKYPSIKMNFNLVPSLIVQLDDYVKDRAKDLFFELSKKKAKSLTIEEKVFILKNFFSCNLEKMIEPYQRYKELYDIADIQNRKDIIKRAKKLDENYFRDLQTWFNLVWIDPLFIKEDEFLKNLILKNRDFTEEEKLQVLKKHIEIIKKILPKYKEMADKKQIEVSTTPFYHPILPILIDSNIAKIASIKNRKNSSEKFSAKIDADKQVANALNLYKKVFNEKPKGMWPSEGALSNETLNLILEKGINWVATDMDILKKSAGRELSRTHLYKPYRFKDTELLVFFRDKELSDAIGFRYSSMNPENAVNDFFWHLYEIKNAIPSIEKEHVITIVLDGENCWEYFEEDGNKFLNALYKRFEETDDFETILFSEYIEEIKESSNIDKLEDVWPGSWIDSNFDIWIGDKEDNLAWNYLRKTREFLVKEASKKHKNLTKAWEEIYIAEGSDWFWWYGDDHHSLQDEYFDKMFRQHLKNVYLLLDKEPPKYLNSAITKQKKKNIDGQVQTYR